MYIRLKEDYKCFVLGTFKAGSVYKLNKKRGEEIYCEFVNKVYCFDGQNYGELYGVANVCIRYNLTTGGFCINGTCGNSGSYGLGSLSQHIFEIIDKPEAKIKKILKKICNTTYSTLTLQRKK
jgi:hypothetical protein